VESGGPKKARIRWGARRRNLANTIELSMFGGDAACCQITLTTCFQFTVPCVYRVSYEASDILYGVTLSVGLTFLQKVIKIG